MKKFLASAAILASLLSPALGQGFTLPSGTIQQGMMSAQGDEPTATGCTLTAGSTDADGTCTASAASGTIVFHNTGLTNPPFCLLVDASATPVAVYTVTALQITLTTITSTHVLRYHCIRNSQ